jgi:predicted acyl esterase
MLFLPGHRLRLDVSSSDFPAFDRNHNTGGDDTRETDLLVARQRVFHDGDRASRLLLPTIRS